MGGLTIGFGAGLAGTLIFLTGWLTGFLIIFLTTAGLEVTGFLIITGAGLVIVGFGGQRLAIGLITGLTGDLIGTVFFTTMGTKDF